MYKGASPSYRGKFCVDDATIELAKALVAREGIGRAILALRTSPTTFAKVISGLPMTECVARRLTEAIVRAMHGTAA
jgi:hypothetical protein